MITFRSLEHKIVGTVNGKPFNIANTEDNLKAIQAFQTKNATIEEVLEFVTASRKQEVAGSCKYLIFNPVTNEYFLTIGKYRSSHAIPEFLVKYIETSYEKQIDFMPVIKAWARLLSNPRYNNSMANYFNTYISSLYLDKEELKRLMKEEELSEKVAKELATYQDIAITQEGMLATYKVAEIVTWEYMMEKQEDGSYKKVKNDKLVRIPAVLDNVTGEVIEEEHFKKPDNLEDFQFTPAIIKHGDKFFSGNKIGYVYEVGKVQRLPKNAKRNLNNTSGGGGLYSGGLSYIECYRSQGTHVLTCFVDPADILSFQSEGQAFRTDALMPYNVWDEEATLKGMYHSSDYGKTSQKRIEDIIKAAVAQDVNVREEQEAINTARNNGTLELMDGEE